MRKKHVISTVVSAAALVTALSGCSASASVSRTVSADSFERVVVTALSKISDATPEVDCGDDSIAIEDGAEVHCDVNTAGYDVVYDSVATISTDGGDDYHVDVAVDDAPKS